MNVQQLRNETPADVRRLLRAAVFDWLDSAARLRRGDADHCGALTPRERAITARWYIEQAAEAGAAAGHSGWRLP